MFEGLDPKIMLMSAVVFLILLVILNSILYKPMLEFMNKREENIQADESKIAQNKAEANNSDELVGKILSDARLKAQMLKDEQLSEARSQAANIVSEYKVKLQERYQTHTSELIVAKNGLKEQLSADLAGISASLDKSLKNL